MVAFLHALYHKFLFRLRERIASLLILPCRRLGWTLRGMRIGKGTAFSSLYVTWPHQVSIGSNCRIEHDVYFHYDGIYTPGPKIVIGDNCFVGSGCEFNIAGKIVIGAGTLIASGSRFIDHNHSMTWGHPIASQPDTGEFISVGRNVWIGANAIVLADVEIGDGAVVGAGAVVTRSVPAHAIVAGVPARVIGSRRAGEE